MKLNEAIVLTENRNSIVSDDGIGNTPLNRDIDYFGIRVLMTPINFLKLAAKTGSSPKMESVQYFVNALLDGNPLAQPFLTIDIPEAWRRGTEGDGDIGVPKVVGHEGRHRMLAISQVYGRNYPVEVHLSFDNLRRRHIESEWIEEMMYDGIEEEDSSRIVVRPFMLF